jgi:hypothetical protein
VKRRSIRSEGVALSAPLYATVALGSLYTIAKDLVTFMNDIERYWPYIVIALIFIVAIILIIVLLL